MALEIDVVDIGLCQMDDEALQRIIDHKGKMLLTGGIYEPGVG